MSACAGESGEQQPVSASEYKDVLATALQDFGSRIDDVEGFDDTGRETKAEGRALLAALRRQRDRLAAIEPPEDAGAAHDRLVDGPEGLGDHIESELEALEQDATAATTRSCIDSFAQLPSRTSTRPRGDSTKPATG